MNQLLMVRLTLFFFLSTLFMVHSQNENSLVNEDGTLQEFTNDFSFTEGPARDKAGNIYFTDQPNDRILRWDAVSGEITTYMQPSGRANGLYFDKDENLLACADEKFQLWQIDPDKQVKVLLNNFKNQDFNGPNDLWIHPNGNIYFTDPYYQRPYWKRQKGEMRGQHLYLLKPGHKNALIVYDSFEKPNGLIGSLDGKTLYVADIGADKTFSFHIKDDGTLSDKKLFVAMGSDGMTTDEHGNVYLTNQLGVTAFDPLGEKVLNIPIPKNWTANVTFAGKSRDILFITAMDAVYTIKMNVKGVIQVVDH